jgi:hypothetical protein
VRRLVENTNINLELLGEEDIDGIHFVVYSFSNFSPYAFIDKLNEQE